MVIKVSDLSFAYERGPNVLTNVNFELNPGEIVALIGRNGSGKTTLLELISQILETKNGDILLDDKSLRDNPELKLNLAYMPDSFNFFPYDSGNSAISYYRLIYPDFDKDFVIKEAKSLNLNLKSNIKNLSKGNKAILGLLISLATGAEYLLLDEALDGLDVLNKGKIMEYILDAQEDGKTVLLSSHQLDELEGIADRIIYLDMDGNIEMFDDAQKSIIKMQVVVKDKLPSNLEDIFLIRQHIGRVYTVLVENRDDLEDLLKQDDIILYDYLKPKLEDFFYWEDGGKSNENI